MARVAVRKGLRAVEDAASERCHEVAKWVVLEIATSPNTPDSRTPKHREDKVEPRALRKPESKHLRNSFSVRTDPVTGDALIVSSNHYWVFVENGTGHGDEQPFLAPALEKWRAEFG